MTQNTPQCLEIKILRRDILKMMNQEHAHLVKFCEESPQKNSRKMQMVFVGFED